MQKSQDAEKTKMIGWDAPINPLVPAYVRTGPAPGDDRVVGHILQ